MAPRRRIRRQASSPAANDGNPKARRPSPSGTGWTRNRASVMTPSVPSLPTNNWVRSGPVAERGPLPPVRMTWPSASTTSRPMTMSSIFPYRFEYWPAPRQASQPPTVERSIDCGQ